MDVVKAVKIGGGGGGKQGGVWRGPEPGAGLTLAGTAHCEERARWPPHSQVAQASSTAEQPGR